MTNFATSRQAHALAEASSAELDSWLSQELQDELGTPAYILRAVAWCRRGAFARARADVDAALAKLPAHELVELGAAVVSFVIHDYERALTLLEGVARRHRYLAAQTLRLLVARAQRLGWTAREREARQQLAALGVRDLQGHIRGLQRPRPRDAEQAWADLYALGPQAVQAQLDVLAQAGADAHPNTNTDELAGVRARLALLEGRLDDAADLLGSQLGSQPSASCEPLALALARGQLDEVVAAAADPADPADARRLRLRGEALLGLGQREAARAALDQAAALEPEHPTTELLRILARDRDHDRDGLDLASFAALEQLAPGLLSDAARDLELPLWTDAGLVEDEARARAICVRALALITADRSTPVSYRAPTSEGAITLRHVPEPARARATHAHDDRDLNQITALLLRTIEKRRGPQTRAHTAKATRSLDAEQIERFIDEGYVHLRGAFPRTLAESIVASAHRRLREAPERCLPEAQAKRWAERLRATYDPDDPATWPRGRLDIEGERRFTMAEFSPFAERAVFQLVGDAARLRTRSWTSNLIAQYPAVQAHAQTPARSWVPGPGQESWHLDSPSPRTRLDDLRTGLLVFVIFSDLERDSGNTWLALDSPAKVARTLAAAPEGVDFVADEAAPAITLACERLFELTGEAGDLLLVHPLMLHSGSPNPSARIRFLGNPMVYLQEPLEPGRAQPSPVEVLIARALE